MIKYKQLNAYIKKNKKNLYAYKRPFNYFVGNEYQGWIIPKEEFIFDLGDFKECSILGASRNWKNETLQKHLEKVSRGEQSMNHGLKSKGLDTYDGYFVKAYEYFLPFKRSLVKIEKTKGVTGEVMIDDRFLKYFKQGYYVKIDPLRSALYIYGKHKKIDRSVKYSSIATHSQLIGITRAWIKGEERPKLFEGEEKA